MAKIYNKHVTDALDECAPVKEFKINHNHKFGLKKEQ